MDLLEVSSLESLTRMTKADLAVLRQKLEELHTTRELTEKPLKELLDEQIAGKPLKEMTLEELAEKVRNQGPLGLGILPEVRRAVRDEIRALVRGLRKKKE